MFYNNVFIAVLIFILTYIVIISEKINRTVIALLGAVLMVVFQVISQQEAFHTIDFNTIGLLIGMMITVNILKRTGIFQYLAIKVAKLAKGDPCKIMVYFMIMTGISSALLDNVTTILLIAPVTFVITDTLEVNPIPFMISEILAANVGGTATLIGDPPNIMIGGATGIGFMDFIINLAPVVIIIFTLNIFLFKWIYRKSLIVEEKQKEKILGFDETKTIKDKSLLIKSFAVLGIVIIGFAIHQFLGLESATIALFGGTLLLLISKIDPEEILIEIEWTTIFFFLGLFILVGSLEKVGVIGFLAEKMIGLTNGNLVITTMVILWLAAIASAFLDNIPFVATMIPLIQNIGTISSINTTPLWWALALGACLGGNGTLVGASANVIIGGMLEKHGHKLSFAQYMKIGFPLTILSIIICTIYLKVVYL